jgi:HYR domain-containing protein
MRVRFVRFVAAGVAVLAAAATALPGQGVARGQLVDTLAFKAEVPITYPPTPCPAGTADSVECSVRTGRIPIRGLGVVEESYSYFLLNQPPGCAVGSLGLLASTARLRVAGKGDIELRVHGTGTSCLFRTSTGLSATESFTVTGGSGIYAGASGAGTITHRSEGPPAWQGRDTWDGTLVVPGLEFDLTPPAFTGAVAKVVSAPRGAKRVRVRYSVTATDNVDGAVRATCQPRSGLRFRIGRTTVRCSATDASANTRSTRFIVTVKRRR